MRKTIICVLFLISLITLFAEFDPISPEIQSLIGKPVTDPKVIYVMDKIGLIPEKFADTSYQTYKADNYELLIMLKKDKIWYVKLTFRDPETAEKASKPILKYYGIPYVYQEPDHKKWKDGNDYLGDGTIENTLKYGGNHLVLYHYKDKNDIISQIYYNKHDDKYVVGLIYIYGEFPRKYKKKWQDDADKYYSTISDERKADITNAFSADPEVKKAVAQKVDKLSKMKIAAQVDPAIAAKVEKMKKMASVVTIWDEYLKDEWKITELIRMFSLTNISDNDLQMLIDKFGFDRSYTYYTHPDKKYRLIIEQAGDSYRLAKIEILTQYGDTYPSIGLDEKVTLDYLESKFGLCWYKYSKESPYEVFASGNKDNSDHSIKFQFIRGAYEKKIKRISIELINREDLLLDGNINFLTGGCLWGDCENGKGIYQYTNNKWVVGLFKDGKKTHGIPEDYDAEKILEEIDYQKKNPCSWARKLDNSFWAKLLYKENGISAITLAFNKRDFSNEDKDILLNNYWFKYEYNWYKSPDGKISCEVPKNSNYIHQMVINVRSLEDLQSFGFERHYSKQELESMLGYEYIRYSNSFNAVLVPKGDPDKNNHLQMSLGLNTTKNTITSVTLRPFNKEKIHISNTLVFLKTGSLEKPDVTFQFADGPRFIGKTFMGIPWTGTIYAYHRDIDYMNLQSGKPDRGFAPEFIRKAEENADPAFKAINKFTRLMEAYREDEMKMLEHLTNLAEHPEDNDDYKRAVLNACKKAEYKLIDARSTFRIIFVNVERSELDCKIASTEIARIFTSLSYFRDTIETFRKIVKQNGKKTPEDEKIMNGYEEYDKQIVKSYDSLVSALFDCGFFQRDPEKWSK